MPDIADWLFVDDFEGVRQIISMPYMSGVLKLLLHKLRNVSITYDNKVSEHNLNDKRERNMEALIVATFAVSAFSVGTNVPTSDDTIQPDPIKKFLCTYICPNHPYCGGGE